MPKGGVEPQLSRISKAKNRELRGFREGLYLSSSTAQSLDDLRDQACSDRLELAAEFAAAGDKLLKSRPTNYRSAIGRFYYSMYQTMRAVSFFVHDGDDHEKHEHLPKATPPDFPDAALWENRLKDARSRRNDADYEPYPKTRSHFRPIAIDLQIHANHLIPVAKTYLIGKGCGRL